MQLGSRPPVPRSPAAQKEHPRHDGVGVDLSHAGPHPGKHPPPAASQKREQTEQALACVCRLPLPSRATAVGAGPSGPEHKGFLCPWRCPDAAPLTQPSLNSAHIWAQPLDPHIPAGTPWGKNRQGFQDARLLGA